MLCRLRLHWDWRRDDRRRRWKPNLDQPLDRVASSNKIHVKAAQQDEAERNLHDGDERECDRALARPHRPEPFSLGGHPRRSRD